MRALRSVFLIRFRETIQYRKAVLGGFLCQTFFGLILIALYRALYATHPQSLPLTQVVTYVWLQQAFFRMLQTQDSELTEKIGSGAIAYDLCRPISPYAYYYIRDIAGKLVSSTMRAVPMIVLAVLLPDGWRLCPPVSFVSLLCALFSLGLGLLCVCALSAIARGFTLLTLDGRGIESLMNVLMLAFSGNLLPLTLFPESWQQVIRLSPYAQLLDAPVRIYLGQQPFHTVPGIWVLQAGWTVVLVLIGIYLWRKNQKQLVLQGG